MYSRFVKVNSDLLNCATVQLLSAVEFKRQFMAAFRGESTAFDGFVRQTRAGWSRPPHWLKLRKFVFERDGYTCTYCGDKSELLECDHIVPLSKGGSDEASNLTTACRPCNRLKRANYWTPNAKAMAEVVHAGLSRSQGTSAMFSSREECLDGPDLPYERGNSHRIPDGQERAAGDVVRCVEDSREGVGSETRDR